MLSRRLSSLLRGIHINLARRAADVHTLFFLLIFCSHVPAFFAEMLFEEQATYGWRGVPGRGNSNHPSSLPSDERGKSSDVTRRAVSAESAQGSSHEGRKKKTKARFEKLSFHHTRGKNRRPQKRRRNKKTRLAAPADFSAVIRKRRPETTNELRGAELKCFPVNGFIHCSTAGRGHFLQQEVRCFYLLHGWRLSVS